MGWQRHGSVGRRILALLGLLWTGGVLASNTPPLIVEHLTTLDGLPQGTLLATLQSSQGFIWFATEDGLVRFDGHEIHRYAHVANDPDSLPGNFINALAEDAGGDLWIAVKGAGIARWHRDSDKFTVYRHDPSRSDSLASDAVRSLAVDNRQRIWVGTQDRGIDVLDPRSGQIVHIDHERQPDGLIDDRVQTLYQDRSGAMWVGTLRGADRWRFDGPLPSHDPLMREALTDLDGKTVSQFLEDGDGSQWVGTLDAGLFHFDGNGRTLAVYRHDAARPNSLGSDRVTAILEDLAGRHWVGTDEGLDLLVAGADAFDHFRHDRADADSISDSHIMSLYQDPTGLLWIGTRAGGVNRWNPRGWELGGRRPDWLNDKLVTAFADAPDNRLWVASLGGGLVRFDPQTGGAADLDSIVQRRDVLGDQRVMALHRDRHGNLWIGTMTSGLKKLSPDGTLVGIPVREGDLHSLSAAGIMTIFEAKSGLLWIGTFGGGADILDPTTGIVRQLPFKDGQTGALSAANVTSFAEDASGNMWIGTDGGGLDLTDGDGKLIRAFLHDSHAPDSLSVNTVFALAIDDAGRLWVATDGGGLDRAVGSSASPESIRFDNLSRSDGLSSDTIYGVIPDAAGRLWLSGNAGLMRFDPASRAIKTYHREHGLQGEEFDSGAYHRMPDGRMCFGGPGGFNLFDPAQLSEGSSPPRLVLTGLEILGAPVHTSRPTWSTQQVALDYRDNVVSFDFAVLDFKSPSRNRIAYRMAGLTDHWIDLNTQHRVTLTNLDAGDHLLEVRAANADMVWSTTPLRVNIHKDRAPWFSAGAYACYGLAGIALIAFLLRAQRGKLRQAAAIRKRLESEVALQTKELRDTNQRLIVASEAKSMFLARMSHELRTPMNGVVGMTELLARAPMAVAQSRQIAAIRTSAKTLLQILNDLLDLSKAQAGKIEIESLPIDLTQILDECAALFGGAAETKGLELIVCPPADVRLVLLADPLRIRQVLMNLIGNAIKFTEAGEIVVTCNIVAVGADSAKVQLIVADTGIGMNEEAAARIFEPFTQADETTTRRFGGSGLGLSICQELVERMGGEITVASEPGVGSRFTVSLELTVQKAARLPVLLDSRILGSIALITRRRGLRESLQRYAEQLGLSVVPSGLEGELAARAKSQFVIVDADSCIDLRDSSAAFTDPDGAALIVVASTEGIAAQRLDELPCKKCLVRKPVSRDALREAIASAAGVPRSCDSAAPQKDAETGARPEHVLIVEDDDINAAVAEGYLRELGCTSVWIQSAASIGDLLAAEHFDMILMDLNMPGLDGYAATKLIRDREPAGTHIPIVALTANDVERQRDVCREAGLDEVLGKPYTLAQLAELLSRWFHRDMDLTRRQRPVQVLPATLRGVDRATVGRLRKLRSSDQRDLFPRLVELFRHNAVDALTRIGAALLAGDLAQVAALSHKMKSGAANVGALAFAEGLAELERVSLAGDSAAARIIYANLTAEHPALMEELMSLSLRATA
jgi:signal transduction histidine kinase/ligand-binding sensor domain-containing protein/CheY-like chemotaxis protein/HPt (histidine-containing phosphotransfer) domain-containing protein